MFKIILRFVDSKQRGRARFVIAEVRVCAACPLPNLLDSGEVVMDRLPPSQLVRFWGLRFQRAQRQQIGNSEIAMASLG